MKIPGSSGSPNPLGAASDALAAAGDGAKKANKAVGDAAQTASQTADRVLQAQSGLLSQAAKPDTSSTLASMTELMRTQAADDRDNLQALKDRIDQNNAFRGSVRALKDAVVNGDSKTIRELLNPGPDGASRSPFIGMPQVRVKGLEIADLLDGDLSRSQEDLQASRADMQRTLDVMGQGLSDINQQLTFQLQMTATQVNQAEEARSNVLKKFSDSADSVIRNI